MPDQVGERVGHVTLVHDHLVVLGAEAARERLGGRALVEDELEALDRCEIEASRECHQPRRALGCECDE